MLDRFARWDGRYRGFWTSSPIAMAGAIPGLVKNARHGLRLRVQPVGHPVGLVVPVVREMAMDMVPGRVVSRHERRPARRTDRGAGVELLEPRTFLRQPVEVGRLQVGMTVASEVLPALVIGEEEDEVGAPWLAARPLRLVAHPLR